MGQGGKAGNKVALLSHLQPWETDTSEPSHLRDKGFGVLIHHFHQLLAESCSRETYSLALFVHGTVASSRKWEPSGSAAGAGSHDSDRCALK